MDYDALAFITAASPRPHHAEILEVAASDITGICIHNDYVGSQHVVDDGTVDANYLLHLPYLEDFNARTAPPTSASIAHPRGSHGSVRRQQTTLDALSYLHPVT